MKNECPNFAPPKMAGGAILVQSKFILYSIFSSLEVIGMYGGINIKAYCDM